MDSKDALEVLLAAKKSFEELGIDYWLTDGTLLGLYRDGDFIPWDDDIDMGVHINSHSSSIIKAFENNGLRYIKTLGTIENGLEYTFEMNNINLDIFFFYSKGDTVWYGNWSFGNFIFNSKIMKKLGLSKPKLIKFSFPSFQLKKWNFRDHDFLIPENPEQYLSLKYGESWATPTKEWNWASSPKNIVE